MTSPVQVGRKSLRWALLVAVVGPLTAAGASRASRLWKRDDPLSHVPLQVVHRADLGSILTASGTIESSNNTVITCQLEKLDFKSNGSRMSSGGASVIIDLVEEGTVVKEGDVLCRLDSSEYEELVRQQKIKTDQAQAELLQARLDFEVAELGVREYREGVLAQTKQNYDGQIAFAESTLERAIDRLEWTKRMLEKGYASPAQRSTAERTVEQARHALSTLRWQLDHFQRFGNPRSEKELAANVEKARYTLIAGQKRVKRYVERLKYYERMVGYCTIRAPHDGFVIYATDSNRSSTPRIEPGVTVRQQQKLFLLPDLDQMNVLAYLHESVMKRVQAGMTVRARIDGLGGRSLPGRVVSVAPLPVSPNGWLTNNEVKYFIGTIKLDGAEPGMRPGMTAQVEIDVDRRVDVLAIPSEAVAVVEGHEVCYVAGEAGLECRPITIGQSTKDFLEVTSGLNEGEEVVMGPNRVESLDALVATTEAPDSDENAPLDNGSGEAPVYSVD